MKDTGCLTFTEKILLAGLEKAVGYVTILLRKRKGVKENEFI